MFNYNMKAFGIRTQSGLLTHLEVNDRITSTHAADSIVENGNYYIDYTCIKIVWNS
jgi:hypothetical protein